MICVCVEEEEEERENAYLKKKINNLNPLLSPPPPSKVALGVKSPPPNCRRCRRRGFDPWVRKIPGGRDGNPLQYSCLENPRDRSLAGYSPQGRKKSDMTEPT